MTREFEKLRDAALELSVEERSLMAEQLLDSTRTQRERQVEEAWIAEVESRIKAIENGTAELIPGDQVIRELRSKYAAPKRRRTR
jgi:putative addiction module component (TIGR02574 family)